MNNTVKKVLYFLVITALYLLGYYLMDIGFKKFMGLMIVFTAYGLERIYQKKVLGIDV